MNADDEKAIRQYIEKIEDILERSPIRTGDYVMSKITITGIIQGNKYLVSDVIETQDERFLVLKGETCYMYTSSPYTYPGPTVTWDTTLMSGSTPTITSDSFKYNSPAYSESKPLNSVDGTSTSNVKDWLNGSVSWYSTTVSGNYIVVVPETLVEKVVSVKVE